MVKAIAIGIGSGLALSGFWNLQDTHPIVANVIVIVLTVPFLLWALRLK